MQETTNLKLPLYELNDAANLADGYNAAMKILDNHAKQIDDKFPITSENIEDGGINTVDLANGCVTTNKLASAAVTTEKLADGAVEAQDIADGAVTAPALADGAVTAPALADGAVTAPALADGAVTLLKISNNAFDTAPTQESPNLLSSGVIWAALQNVNPDAQDTHFVAFGDSYTNGSFIKNVSWADILSNFYSETLHNYAVNGAGIVRSIEPGGNFATQIQNAKADDSYNHNNVKHVYIMFGCNDYSNWNSSSGIYTTTLLTDLQSVKEEFPNAEIHFYTNDWCTAITDFRTNLHDLNYYEQCASACAQAGVLCSSVANVLRMSDTFYGSDYHPTDAGQKAIASCMLTPNNILLPAFSIPSMTVFNMTSTSNITFTNTSTYYLGNGTIQSAFASPNGGLPGSQNFPLNIRAIPIASNVAYNVTNNNYIAAGWIENQLPQSKNNLRVGFFGAALTGGITYLKANFMIPGLGTPLVSI